MAYTAPTFVNDSAPALNANNMNDLAQNVENLQVANGGTGRQTLTSGAILTGNGANPVGQLTGTGAVYATSNGNPTMGTLPVSCGGTGATSLDALRTALGLSTAGFVVQASAPSDTTKLWINSTNSTMNYYNGSRWVAIRGVFA